MRIVFMGTPEFGAASLRALIRDGADVCAVFTQPDKPKNRGMCICQPPVKTVAEEHGIPVYQRLRCATARRRSSCARWNRSFWSWSPTARS